MFLVSLIKWLAKSPLSRLRGSLLLSFVVCFGLSGVLGYSQSVPGELAAPLPLGRPRHLHSPQWEQFPAGSVTLAAEQSVPSEQAAATAPSEAEVSPVEVPVAQEEVSPPLPAQDLSSGGAVPVSGDPQVDVGGSPQIEINGLIKRFQAAQQKNKRIQVAYTAEARFAFDDNIFIRSKNAESDFYSTFSPGITIGMGDFRSELRRVGIARLMPLNDEDEDFATPQTFIFAHYSPTITLFAQHGSQNDLDHDASINGQWKQAYLTLGFRTAYQTLSTPEVDIGARVKRSFFTQEVTSDYDYSDRTSFEFNFSGTARRYEIGVDSNEFVNQNWFNYAYGARTTIGAGLKLGYLQVQDSADQLYEQLLVRTRYTVTNKIDATANLGVELREIQSGGENKLNPVFGLGLSYRPFPQTFVTLEASRETENSASNAADNIEVTGMNFSIRQRLFKRYFFGLSSSYQNVVYAQTSTAFAVARTDNTFSLSPSVRMELTKQVGLELGYELRKNTSTQQTLSFTENQVFVQIDVLF